MNTKTAKTTKARQAQMFIELFELFSQQTPDGQKEALKTFDEMLLRQPPQNADLFAKLRNYLMELQKASQT
jgi:hypothetical protein